MATRITQKFLEQQAKNLNKRFGFTGELYRKDDQGRIIGGVEGTYLISCAYGGYALHTMCSSTGQNDVFGRGHMPARELSELIYTFNRGIDISLIGG